MCQDVFALQPLLQWQEPPETTFHVCFSNKPMGLFCKTHECVFIHPISFSSLFFAKGNMIEAAQEEFWAAVRYNGCVSHRTQKTGEISVDALEEGW